MTTPRSCRWLRSRRPISAAALAALSSLISILRPNPHAVSAAAFSTPAILVPSVSAGWPHARRPQDLSVQVEAKDVGICRRRWRRRRRGELLASTGSGECHDHNDDDDNALAGMSEQRLGAALSDLFDLASLGRGGDPEFDRLGGFSGDSSASGDAFLSNPQDGTSYLAIDELRELEGRPPAADPLFSVNVDESVPPIDNEEEDEDMGGYLSAQEYLALSRGADPRTFMATQRLGGGSADREAFERLTESLMTPHPPVPPGYYRQASSSENGDMSADTVTESSEAPSTSPFNTSSSPPPDPEELHRQVFQEEAGFLEQSEAFRKFLSSGVRGSRSDRKSGTAERRGGTDDQDEQDPTALRRGAAYRQRQDEAMRRLDREMEAFLRDMPERGTLSEGVRGFSKGSGGALPKKCAGCGAILTPSEVSHGEMVGGPRKLCRECDVERLSVKYPSQMNPPIKPFYSWDERTDDVMQRDRERSRTGWERKGRRSNGQKEERDSRKGARIRRSDRGLVKNLNNPRDGEAQRGTLPRETRKERRDSQERNGNSGKGTGKRRAGHVGNDAYTSLESSTTTGTYAGQELKSPRLERLSSFSPSYPAPYQKKTSTVSPSSPQEGRLGLARGLQQAAVTSGPSAASPTPRDDGVGDGEVADDASQLSCLQSIMPKHETQIAASRQEAHRIRQDVRILEGELEDTSTSFNVDIKEGGGKLSPSPSLGEIDEMEVDDETWQLVEDPDGGESFYWNEVTEEMRWDL